MANIQTAERPLESVKCCVRDLESSLKRDCPGRVTAEFFAKALCQIPLVNIFENVSIAFNEARDPIVMLAVLSPKLRNVSCKGHTSATVAGWSPLQGRRTCTIAHNPS